MSARSNALAARRRLAMFAVAICLAATVIGGCRDERAIDSARAKLDLARTKANLDEMYLALREVQSLGGASGKDAGELSAVSAGIALQQEMNAHNAAHEHEKAVSTAGKLLASFPDHLAALKTIKESGLIFRTLESAVGSLRNCFTDSMTLVTLTDGHHVGEPDFDRMLYNLDKAGAQAKAARELDPQFERAIALEKLVADLKSNVVLTLSLSAGSALEKTKLEVAGLFDTLYEGMRVSRSPQSYLSRAAKHITAWSDVGKEDREYELERAALLARYAPESPLAREVAELGLQVKGFFDCIVHPRGTLVDYRTEVQDRNGRIVDLINKVVAAVPSGEALTTSTQGFAQQVNDFQLFRTPNDTKVILDQYAAIIES